VYEQISINVQLQIGKNGQKQSILGVVHEGGGNRTGLYRILRKRKSGMVAGNVPGCVYACRDVNVVVQPVAAVRVVI
jgi:hypothetical protein